VNPDLAESDHWICLQLRKRQWRRDARTRVGMQLSGSSTDERKRNRVLSGIAALRVRLVIILMERQRLVFVSCQPVMVLGVIVAGVRVSVQRGLDARDSGQRGNQRHYERAAHRTSVCNDGDRGQRPAPAG
jgi:hypothetical protein